jgi:outer membrane protein TolC
MTLSYKPFVICLTALAVSTLLPSCAVGPNFKKPAAPAVKDYTPSPVSTTASTTNVLGGEAQRFVTSQDIAGDWWTLFHSKPLNALIDRSLKANPNLKAAQAALVVARENVLAQKGAYYPSVAGSFSASRQKTASAISPTPNNGDLYFNLYTPQVNVSYVPDVFGLNRRTVESLNAQAEQARFAWVASDIALSANVAAAAIQEASLREQIEATHHLIEINTNMLRILKTQFTNGYADRLDVAAQESQLA